MKQLSFPCYGRGGWRPGAGRKRGPRQTHHGREQFTKLIPIHAIWRTCGNVRSLRGKRLWRQIRESLCRYHEKLGFRVVHFAVMGSHIHLILEAIDTGSLSRGMQGLGVSMAKRVNMTSERRGHVFDDRFFARPLRTPREVANAVDYVLHNEERHQEKLGLPPPVAPEAFTSETFRGCDRPLVSPPQTWLLAIGRFRASGGGTASTG